VSGAATRRVRGPLVLLLLLERGESTRRRHEKALDDAHGGQEQGRSEQRVHVLTRHFCWLCGCIVVVSGRAKCTYVSVRLGKATR